tara:strand:- start:985 stop:1578 length:594 start_codon:yes stop_codon:yes gene_type:complete
MDNTIIPYEDVTDDSDEDLSDSSDDDEHSHLLTNNIGVHFNKFMTQQSFMNMEDPKEYAIKRNRIFTPEITKRIFTVKLNALSTIFSLEDDIKLPIKNIIGFKITKSNFLSSGNILFLDLSIPEIPEIACDKNEAGKAIIARIPLNKTNDNYHIHTFLELSMLDRYFFPQPMNKLTFNLSSPLQGFIVIELSYLNDM